MGASAPGHFRDSGPSLSFHVLPAPILAGSPRGTCREALPRWNPSALPTPGPTSKGGCVTWEGRHLRCKHAAPFSKEMDRRPHSRCLILPRRATFEIVDRAHNIRCSKRRLQFESQRTSLEILPGSVPSALTYSGPTSRWRVPNLDLSRPLAERGNNRHVDDEWN